jgi:Lectin C-type domain
MRTALLTFVIASAGCASGVVSDPGEEAPGVDAQAQAVRFDGGVIGVDGSVIPAPAPDAQLPDAAPPPPACTGGDANSLDPVTGHCYLAFTVTQRTWIDARMACAALGPRTQLVTLNSQAENDRVNTLLGANESWIGFDDSMVEGNFVWVTGEATLYTNWAPGEPNNGGSSGEDCALTNRAGQLGRWDDRDCRDDYAFVCERVP